MDQISMAQNEKKRGILEGILKGRQEGILEGRQEGILEGRQEGRQKGIVETASNLLQMGLSIEQIIKATNLSKEDIEKLR